MEGYEWSNSGRKSALVDQITFMLKYLSSDSRDDMVTYQSLGRLLEELKEVNVDKETVISYQEVEDIGRRLGELISIDNACRAAAQEYEKEEVKRSWERARAFLREYMNVELVEGSRREAEEILVDLQNAHNNYAEGILSGTNFIAFIMKSYERLFKKLGMKKV